MLAQRFPVAYLLAITTSAALLATVVGCGNKVDTNAVNVLGTDKSIFAKVDLDQMITVRSDREIETANSSIDLSLLSPQHFLAVVIDGKQLRSYFDSRQKNMDQLLLEPKPASISLEDVTQLLFMLDDSILKNAMSGGTSSGWSVQLNFDKAVDQIAWQKWMLGPTSNISKIGESEVQMLSDGSLGLMWLDESRAVLASKEELKSIQKRADQRMTTQLGNKILERYQGEFVFLGMQAEPLRKLVDEISKLTASWGQNDERLNTVFAGARALEDIEFRAFLDGDDLGQLSLRFADETSAKGIKTLVTQAIEQFSNVVGANTPGPTNAPANPATGISAELQKLIKDLQKELADGGLQTTQQENLVTLNMNRPKRFDDLVDQSLLGWQKAKSQLYQSRKAGEIAVALQRFEKLHGRLPANNASPLIYSNTKENETADSPKFSWRVAILPQLGFQELFDSFDFSQPWDSETNRKAAARMPAVFAWQDVPESGERNFVEDAQNVPKSDFHMLTGAAGAAGEVAIHESSQVADGADRTMLIHQTPQLESEWTQPDAGWEVSDANDMTKMQTGTEEATLAILYSGRVVAITPQMSREDWFGWVTPAGKERVNRTLFKQVTVFAPLKDSE